MRGSVVRAPDGSDSSVGGDNQYRRHVILQCTIQKGEALDVEHVNFVDEEDARYDFCFAFFPPLRYLCVDLFPNFCTDFTGITRKQCQKSLRSEIWDGEL